MHLYLHKFCKVYPISQTLNTAITCKYILCEQVPEDLRKKTRDNTLYFLYVCSEFDSLGLLSADCALLVMSSSEWSFVPGLTQKFPHCASFSAIHSSVLSGHRVLFQEELFLRCFTNYEPSVLVGRTLTGTTTTNHCLHYSPTLGPFLELSNPGPGWWWSNHWQRS